MILRLASPAARWTLLSISSILAAGLAYFSLRNAWAEHLEAGQTPASLERAARLEPGNARHWYVLGHYWQYNLEQPDSAQAIFYYRRSLSLDPRSPATWLDLGDSYEAEGDLKSAREALLQAKSNYPISAEAAWRYGNFLIRQGELRAAYGEILRSITEEPGRAAEAVSVCWRANPDINAILDQALPASRDVYLSAIAVLAGQRETDAALAVWARLAALHPQLQLKKIYPFLDALLAKRQISAARDVWNQSLSLAGIARPDDPAASLLWDGGFETDVTDGGFSWRVQPVRGAQIGFDTTVKRSGSRSLRVHFDGSQNIHFEHVCQIAGVEPGTPYQFSAWVRTDAVTTDRGIHFRLLTPESREKSPTVTSELRGTESWTMLSLSWTPAKDVHLVQACLTRAPSGKLDNQIAGTVWVDDVTLIPETTAPAAARPAHRARPAGKDQP